MFADNKLSRYFLVSVR